MMLFRCLTLRNRFAFKQFMALKPSKYEMLFQSLNSVMWPFTHSTIVVAGKPENGSVPYYIKNIPDRVKKLVKNQKRKIKIFGRSISMDT